MQSSVRSRDTRGGGYSGRRTHAPQLSISDNSHHVTEAIGHMYEDDSYDSKRDSTASMGSSPTSTQPRAHGFHDNQYSPRSPIGSRDQGLRKSNELPRSNGAVMPPNIRNNSWERGGEAGALSRGPSMRGRSPSDTATSQFPLNDIDYESSPAAVAQELSNLQALRRMSMDVAAAGDPDLPAMNGGPIIPSIAPSPADDEDDTSRLFWVPARIHPELAPTEFKSFLDSKAEQIKRKSGEFSYSPEGSPSPSRSGSLTAGASLRRKKSMLSRQIDKSGDGYQDGAERLERKKSLLGSQRKKALDPNLEELEKLVTDPERLQRLSLESTKQGPPVEGTTGEDMPIIPALGPASSLKRSTRTTYRRGSQTKKSDGGRMTFSKRMQEAEEKRKAAAVSATEVEPAKTGQSKTVTDSAIEEPRPLTRVSTEPSAMSAARTTNFSRPARGSSPTEGAPKPLWDSALDPVDQTPKPSVASETTAPAQRQWQSRLSSGGRSTLQIPPENQTVPQIIVDSARSPEEAKPQPAAAAAATPASTTSLQNRLPERSSSHQPPSQQLPQQVTPQSPMSQGPNGSRPTLTPRSSARPGMPARQKSPQTLDQMAGHPSPLPGSNDITTKDLSFIPTLTEDKKADSRKVKEKKDEPRKSSWNWLLGKEESEKEKKKEEESKRPKAKITKPPERHDNTRLDVLQSSIDGGNKGRESVVLDRESVKLEEERKKESQRKSGGSDTKKEKDGLFSSIFGGNKKKGGDGAAKKYAGRALSPEPPPRQLKPDIDYNWTRFSILEERAIYRMAHIKLANPRRALYSQVLLSNFMYSYLAKVQQMHPQMNLPTSAKQQSQQHQAQKAKHDQPDEFTQYQRYQKQQESHQRSQQQEYARQKMSGQGFQQGNQSQQYHGQDDYYEGDSNMYDYDNDGRRPSSRGGKHGLENGGMAHSGAGLTGQYQQHSDFGDDIQGDDDDMW